jgi:hypothetical protein
MAIVDVHTSPPRAEQRRLSRKILAREDTPISTYARVAPTAASSGPPLSPVQAAVAGGGPLRVHSGGGKRTIGWRWHSASGRITVGASSSESGTATAPELAFHPTISARAEGRISRLSAAVARETRRRGRSVLQGEKRNVRPLRVRATSHKPWVHNHTTHTTQTFGSQSSRLCVDFEARYASRMVIASSLDAVRRR